MKNKKIKNKKIITKKKDRTELLSVSALFMTLLILSMPFLSVQAFAATTVSVTNYYGKDEVSGYMSSFDDSLTVEMEVTPDTATDSFSNFSETNVYVDVFGKHETVDSCTVAGSSYSCVYTSSTTDRAASEQSLEVSVVDDSASIVASAEEIVYIDGEEPVITNFDYPQYFTGAVNISFEAEDEACSTCGNVCSGFDRYELSASGGIVVNASTETIAGDCDYETVLETSVSELSLTEGSQQLCLEIFDNVQQSDKNCVTVIVDTTAPSIASSSFIIKDDNGNAVEHLSNDPVHATIVVNITEIGSGLESTSVLGNFSSLNENSDDEYNEMLGDCAEYENGVFVCSWNIYVQLSTEKTQTVKIAAADNAGNENVLTKTITFVEDTTVPVPISLISLYGEYFNAANNTLVLEVQEDGSGFDDLHVYLDMNEIMLGNKQASSCSQSGTLWYCFWENFAIPSSVRHGEAVDLNIATLKDDAGNAFDTSSFEEATFIVDEEAPEFVNITIAALGREAAVVTEGDVVAITAYIEEDISGLNTDLVFVDYGDFDSSNDLANPSYCTEVAEDIWECYWEYIGSLNAGEQVELNIIATDNAGNTKDSEDDNVEGKIFVVGISETTGDFWLAEAAVDPLPALNPNFLYFTTTGTIVRVDTALQLTASAPPYVHAYTIGSCQSAVTLVDNRTAKQQWVDAPLVGQYYYDVADKSEKYVLINIPALFYGKQNLTISEGSFIEVVCGATVSQARTEYSDIYSPDEEVNVTATIPLMGGLYTEPSLASVDKIQKLEKLINTLEKLTKFLGIWTKWGTKICSPLNGVRVVANNIVTMLKSINVLADFTATSAVASATQVTNKLNDVWYGYYNKEDLQEKGVEEGRVEEKLIGDKSKTGGVEKFEHTYSDTDNPFSNKYRPVSMGYLCDTVLCESCSENWNQLFKNKDKEKTEIPGIYIGGIFVSNPLTAGVPLNPRENFVVALVCNPPCIPGIYGQLNVYKEILIAYNTCLNIATIKGEDIVECEQFLSAQICQNVVNAFFWHWFYGLKNALVAKFVDIVFEDVLKGLKYCPEGKDSTADPTVICSGWRSLMALITLGTTLVDTYNTMENMFNFENGLFGNKTAEQQSDELEEELDDDIGDQLGTTTEYG